MCRSLTIFCVFQKLLGACQTHGMELPSDWEALLREVSYSSRPSTSASTTSEAMLAAVQRARVKFFDTNKHQRVFNARHPGGKIVRCNVRNYDIRKGTVEVKETDQPNGGFANATSGTFFRTSFFYAKMFSNIQDIADYRQSVNCPSIIFVLIPGK